MLGKPRILSLFPNLSSPVISSMKCTKHDTCVFFVCSLSSAFPATVTARLNNQLEDNCNQIFICGSIVSDIWSEI